jgi:hypothetical protein
MGTLALESSCSGQQTAASTFLQSRITLTLSRVTFIVAAFKSNSFFCHKKETQHEKKKNKSDFRTARQAQGLSPRDFYWPTIKAELTQACTEEGQGLSPVRVDLHIA